MKTNHPYKPRSRRLTLVVGFLIAFVAVQNVTTLTLYRRTRSHLDDELGERLRAVASGAAHAVEIASADSLSTENINPVLFEVLFTVQSENELSNVVLLTPEGHTLIDLGGYSRPGEINPFIDLDYSAVALARSGLPSYTTLYRSGEVYLKSAYAPITATDGNVIAILGVEAGAEFFSILRELRRMIILFTIVSAAVVIMLSALFVRQSRSLDDAHETVLRHENLAAMGQMVANIAHEIRNPLSIIKTSAERLRRKYNLEDGAVDYIVEEVDVLNGVLTGYLDFARSGPEKFAQQRLDKLIARCVMAVQADVQARQLVLESEYPTESLSVYGDEKRLRQAILNVLLNAVQAAPDRGQVRISLFRREKHIIVSVEDNGPGMTRSQVREITRPFYTTRTDGSGLGLSIVEAVMKQHDGKLVINSEPGRGTSVSLEFPLRAPDEPA